MITFKTLAQVIRREDQQTTLQQLLNGRMNVKGQGWKNIILSNDLKKELCKAAAEKIGGREATTAKIYRNLMRSRPQHWALTRFTIEKYNNTAFLDYTAGQDQQEEFKMLRKELKRLLIANHRIM